MKQLKFNIIIPTKNRADTLFWALKTCVEQEYENLQIIVSDNCSVDNTREMVLAIGDPRIKYIKTDIPLSMSGNWEFALGYIKEGFVTFLGDDDAFLPGAIARANKIAIEMQSDAINAACIEYNWPSHTNALNKNKLFFIKNKLPSTPIIPDILSKVLRCQLPYSVLPWLYKGFVSIALIKEALSFSKTFFHSRNPDIYSAIAIGSIIKNNKYYYSNEPFAINGASAHSNGVSQGTTIKNAGALEFLSSLSMPFHKSLVMCNSFPIYVFECYLQAKDCGLLLGNDLITLKEVLEKTMNLAQYTKAPMYHALAVAVKNIGTKNNINADYIKLILKKYPNKNLLLRVANRVKNRYFAEVKQIDMDQFGVQNVYDAADIAHKIINKSIKVPSTKLINTITGDIKSIFKKY